MPNYPKDASNMLMELPNYRSYLDRVQYCRMLPAWQLLCSFRRHIEDLHSHVSFRVFRCYT